MTIRVAIAGARGRMGSEAVKAVSNKEGMELVAALDYKHVGDSLGELAMFPPQLNVPIYTNLTQLIEDEKPDVLIDLTNPESVYEHTKEALLHNVRPVVGTTGFTDSQLEELKNLSENNKVGCIIAPNFAIGAILMMKFAKEAAKYLPNVEIIELHHDRKLDAPSGTGLKTAQLIAEVRNEQKQGHPNEKETIAGARGADFEGMRIHSVRLPGLVAHQEVIFGGDGQMLTIRHDSYNRESFMGGVLYCVEAVMTIEDLVYGLENLI
ncbi:dihydrodipicolinate reductase [Ureibacillus massiliensis 4400831 = CIP 108448 = CCUG 49529]|uniref:4-hydroxy-tetrahydrodipicolinate reductase n=1 Tax=Ureibacillus massiliensis 4400831 = CIP 108448 = CCUG 49529 TaxID=1211035 RepID=A0A0A3IPY7_9BACL|nr:4-hydroxy-tetrahydrodipicolinate reductase [Ureibacillus massiliensis]KGR85545.1 dihydrodipicolinate reductase [Ureibacillus massiliensis 4400831 = CIP 108448 = CCUG 49529]